MKKILTLVFGFCAAIAAQADPPSYVDASALRAYYYLFNDAVNTMPGQLYSGTTSNAPIYNGSHAIFNGQTTGTPDHLNFVMPPLLEDAATSGGFTVSFWVWLTGSQVPYATFFSKWSANRGIIISTLGGNDNRIRVDIGYGSGYNVMLGTQPLDQGSGWTHIAVKVRRNSGGAVFVNLYRNGQQEASNSYSNGYKDSGYSADVGYDSQVAGRAYCGDMKHLAIWTKPIEKCESSMMAVQGNYISNQPTSLTKDVADNASIGLTTNLGNFNPWYIWVDQSNTQVSQVVNGGSSSTLNFTPPLYNGTFQCKIGIDNAFNMPTCIVTSNPVTLTVTCGSVPTPTITGPSNVTVGQQGTFFVPSGSGYSYQWWTSNANPIGGAATPTYTCQFNVPGTTNVYSRYVYGSCEKTSPPKGVTVSSITALGDEMEEGVFGVFPNPASDLLVVKLNPSQVNKAYKLTNQLGQTLLEGTFQSMQTTLNVQHLSPGMYWITSGDNRQSVMVRN